MGDISVRCGDESFSTGVMLVSWEEQAQLAG